MSGLSFLGALIPIALIGLAAAAMWTFIKRYIEQRRAKWQAAADQLGVEFHQGGFLATDQIAGTVDGVGIVIDPFTRKHGKSSTTYTRMRLTGRIPDDLSLKSEGIGSTLKKLFTGEDIQLEDEPFDDAVLVQGREEIAVALLSSDARQLVNALLHMGGRVENGEVYWETRGYIDNTGRLVEQGRYLMKIAKTLSLHEDRLDGHLARNAMHDPKPGVRARNLRMLCARYPNSEATSRAVQYAAQNDGHVAVRLEAAIHLGPAGLETVQRVATEDRNDETLRLRALAHLDRAWPHPHAKAAVDACVRSPRARIRAEAIRLVGRHGYVEARDRVLADASPDRAAELAAAAAEALGRLKHGQAELIALLEHDDDEVKTVAARSLGLMGDIHAVEALVPQTKGIFADRDLKRAASDAIAMIQGRSGAEGGGRLSVVSDSERAGGVSLADAEQGAVSLTEE